MHAFAEQGPYHCLILGGGALDTKGGPVVDPRGRVLGYDGEAIPGVYGAGNCISAPTGQGYHGPGGTVGPALTFGWLAGVAVAARARRMPSFTTTG
ncbi:FAD-binding protein [Blastococcus sp. PRF04-17]|uniref:FAD-binding protein n=1 Tax=Blastococcus sp. PRF04-17 TaxID=2933797 RepID=UPI001FF26EB6|nr:FAD-binding protein [Blastococcus sp. PRF04-17]UOY03610.1 FAD-binding protein [Blastococcus sp. PRF04-17]